MNLCGAKGGSNFLMKYVFLMLKDYSNIKLVCPFPKGDYYVRNAEVYDHMVPQFFPEVRFQITIRLNVVVSGVTGMKELYTCKIVGYVKKNMNNTINY